MSTAGDPTLTFRFWCGRAPQGYSWTRLRWRRVRDRCRAAADADAVFVQRRCGKETSVITSVPRREIDRWLIRYHSPLRRLPNDGELRWVVAAAATAAAAAFAPAGGEQHGLSIHRRRISTAAACSGLTADRLHARPCGCLGPWPRWQTDSGMKAEPFRVSSLPRDGLSSIVRQRSLPYLPERSYIWLPIVHLSIVGGKARTSWYQRRNPILGSSELSEPAVLKQVLLTDDPRLTWIIFTELK